MEHADGKSDLGDFIRTGMRMSHIYQPLMLKVLLENGGGDKASLYNGLQVSLDKTPHLSNRRGSGFLLPAPILQDCFSH